MSEKKRWTAPSLSTLGTVQSMTQVQTKYIGGDDGYVLQTGENIGS